MIPVHDKKVITSDGNDEVKVKITNMCRKKINNSSIMESDIRKEYDTLKQGLTKSFRFYF